MYDAIIPSFSKLSVEPILSKAEAAIILENYLSAKGEWGESDFACLRELANNTGNITILLSNESTEKI